MSDQAPPVSVVNDKDIRIVEFTNNKILDEANIADIGQTLKSLIDESERPKLLLDFATVDHLSSAALGMLINANNLIKQKNGMFRLANIKPQILEVFRITKLDKLFRILPTRPRRWRASRSRRFAVRRWFRLCSRGTISREIHHPVRSLRRPRGAKAHPRRREASRLRRREHLRHQARAGRSADQRDQARQQARPEQERPRRSATSRREQAEIIIEDEGPRVSTASRCPIRPPVENLTKCSGRGILLIEAYMDQRRIEQPRPARADDEEERRRRREARRASASPASSSHSASPMLFPLRTDVPLRSTPWMNWVLILLNVADVHRAVRRSPRSTDATLHLNPRNASSINTSPTRSCTAVRCTWSANMLFLYIFGNNVNDKMGHLGYLGVLPGRCGDRGGGACAGFVQRCDRRQRRASRGHRRVSDPVPALAVTHLLLLHPDRRGRDREPVVHRRVLRAGRVLPDLRQRRASRTWRTSADRSSVRAFVSRC